MRLFESPCLQAGEHVKELATGRTESALVARMHAVINETRGQTLDDALEAVANALRRTAKEAANAHQNVIQLRPGKPALRLVV